MSNILRRRVSGDDGPLFLIKNGTPLVPFVADGKRVRTAYSGTRVPNVWPESGQMHINITGTPKEGQGAYHTRDLIRCKRFTKVCFDIYMNFYAETIGYSGGGPLAWTASAYEPTTGNPWMCMTSWDRTQAASWGRGTLTFDITAYDKMYFGVGIWQGNGNNNIYIYNMWLE